MNGTSQKLRSCVAIQTLNATSQNGATHHATGNAETGRKPASIRELRAQLKAQQDRNQCATENGQVAPIVAHDAESCAENGRGFEKRNCATEVSGPYTPYCQPVSIDTVHELHDLIRRFADLEKYSEDETTRIIDAAKHQALASVPESVRWFKNELKASQ
jgi:hypothetical protein